MSGPVCRYCGRPGLAGLDTCDECRGKRPADYTGPQVQKILSWLRANLRRPA